MTAKPRKPLLLNLTLVAVLVLPVAYVLSYAPVYRALHTASPSPFQDSRFNGSISRLPSAHVPGYAPVDWLIDHTPLREPLFLWADAFGVRSSFQHSHMVRMLGVDLDSIPRID